jgi:hypothetical protein
MGSFEQRIAALAAVSANLITLLKELDQLRELVREAQLSRVRPKRPKQRPASVNRRAQSRQLRQSVRRFNLKARIEQLERARDALRQFDGEVASGRGIDRSRELLPLPRPRMVRTLVGR